MCRNRHHLPASHPDDNLSDNDPLFHDSVHRKFFKEIKVAKSIAEELVEVDG